MTSTFLERVDRTGLAISLVAVLAWGLAADWTGAATLAVGAGIALLNLIVLRHVMGRLVRAITEESGGGGMTGIFLLKFSGMAMVVFLLVAVLRVDAVPLAVGVSVAPLSMLVEFIRYAPAAPTTETSDSGPR